MMFGDVDRLDAWDDDDPPAVRLELLERFAAEHVRRAAVVAEALRLVGKLERLRAVDPDRLAAVREALEDG